ncbi:MAG: endonuclease/exonuclease/phosphatase family protein [Phycisphaerae bacterium]
MSIPNPLRIVTYNIHGCRSGLDRIAAFIRDQEPDIVFLQEATRPEFDPHRRDQAAAIAEELGGYHVASAAGLDYLHPPSQGDPAILSRFDLRDARMIHGKDRGRAFGLLATINAPGRSLHLLSVHTHATFKLEFGHIWESSKTRMIQVTQLMELVEKLDGDVIIAGDFNAADWMPEYKMLTRHWTDFGLVSGDAKLSFPSHQPQVRIDYVFGRGAFETRSYEVLDVRLSDHRPVSALIERAGSRRSLTDDE